MQSHSTALARLQDNGNSRTSERLSNIRTEMDLKKEVEKWKAAFQRAIANNSVIAKILPGDRVRITSGMLHNREGVAMYVGPADRHKESTYVRSSPDIVIGICLDEVAITGGSGVHKLTQTRHFTCAEGCGVYEEVKNVKLLPADGAEAKQQHLAAQLKDVVGQEEVKKMLHLLPRRQEAQSPSHISYLTFLLISLAVLMVLRCMYACRWRSGGRRQGAGWHDLGPT